MIESDGVSLKLFCIDKLQAEQNDIEEKNGEHEALKKIAHYDEVTGLPNRSYFKEVFERAILNAKRRGSLLALFYIDLDDFKRINDTKGHDIGDLFLKGVADRLLEVGRKSDFFARIGGDEFILLSEDIEPPRQPGMIAERLLEVFQEKLDVGEHKIKVSLSIGIAIYPMSGESCEQLLKNADIAMYQAKKSGKNKSMFFSKKLNEAHMRLRYIEESLKEALDEQAFFLEYQPQIDLKTNEIAGFEALLRWQCEDGKVLYPPEFISVAEKLGLIHDIGEWVLERACQEFSICKSTFERRYIKPKLSINLSAIQLSHSGLVNTIEGALSRFVYDRSQLELEITEMALMENIQRTKGVLHKIDSMGIDLVVDDFGKGYSSLSYLKSFPFSTLKVDASFIQGLSNNSDDKAIVKAIIQLSDILGLNIVFEGVEEKPQHELLVSYVEGLPVGRCFAQGFLFARPMRIKKISTFFSSFYDAY